MNKSFKVNGETFQVTKDIINEYHHTPEDKYIFLIDSMCDQGLDIGVEYVDDNLHVADDVEVVEDYIIKAY